MGAVSRGEGGGGGWTSLSLADVEPVAVAGVRWRPLRRRLGVEAFGINAYTAEAAGDAVVEAHTESSLGHEEIYLVLSGRASFTLDEQAVDAPAGTVLFVRDPAVRRHAVAAEPGTTVLAVGGRPGEAFAPSAWEWYFEAERFRPSGEHAAALALLADGRERFPDHPGMLYATACWQALAGEADHALGSLQRAIALDPRTAAWAKDDRDLETLRGLPGFPA